ncbi:hypothetical protein [Tsukamurella tyrosinosolvens]|uniref:hypothetical protein n=1 Tax=Tsukamurella tyrosinosolvens TaxID=57704 RepID=UPI002DD43901|nr:hypothetical protein [Tsukamurella tyrosinosolvens]MEC4616210.1 hypothetical protein [Tsukamurella tyrosinosolvens]
MDDAIDAQARLERNPQAIAAVHRAEQDLLDGNYVDVELPAVSWCPRRECRTCGMKRSAPCSTVCRVHDLRTNQEERTYPMQTAP